MPRNRVNDFVEFVHDLRQEIGIRIKSFGHAGDGNIHIYQCSNSLSKEEFLKKGEIFFHAIYREASRLGGLVSGEHGIGSGKIDYLADSVGEINVELMKGIKKVFDPKGILNPGKVVRLDEENV